jgi:HPt (histidine-containing phosphotransfer) domain-containing protein
MRPAIATWEPETKDSACAGLPPYLRCENEAHAFMLRRINVIHTMANRVYDHQGALARMGQDLELFRVMVRYLATDGPRWMKDLKAAVPARDMPRVQQRAHSLKGLISNFGTARAWRAASSLEDLARAGRSEDLSESLAELESALAELMGALEPYLATENPG